jgi:hypothetical protein
LGRSLSMWRSVAVLMAALFAAAWAAPAFAKTETVTGEVISLSCYFQNKANVGTAGMICAIATVKWEGNPAGLLTAAGKVYQLAGGLVAKNNAKVVPLLGHTVTVTGDVYEKNGITMIAADDAKMVK